MTTTPSKEELHEVLIPCPECATQHIWGKTNSECPECKGTGTIQKYYTEAELEQIATELFACADRQYVLEKMGIIDKQTKTKSKCPFAKGD